VTATLPEALAAPPDPATTRWLPFGAPGGPVVAGAPAVRANRSTSQSIPNSAWTAISFDRVRWDKGAPAAQWSASAPTRLTCQVAGTYLVTGNGMITTGAGTNRYGIIQRNGVQVSDWWGVGGVGVAANGANISCQSIISLNVGDYVEYVVFQDSGAAINFPLDNPGNPYNSDFSMALIGGTKGDPGVGVPTPVVNGQWVKGVSGAAVWQPLAATDVEPALPNRLHPSPSSANLPPPPGNDLNNATACGWYGVWDTGGTPTPATANRPPGITWGQCRVDALSTATSFRQTVYQHAGWRVWERFMQNSGWSSWVPVQGDFPAGWFGPYTVSPGSIPLNQYVHTQVTHNLNKNANTLMVHGWIEDVNYGINVTWAVNTSLGANAIGIYMMCIGNVGGGGQGTAIWHGYIGVGL